MNTYQGRVNSEGFYDGVTVNGDPLPQRQDLRNHSPTGFAWGYGGSGPAQLALAILAFEAGDEVALQHYQKFKFSVIGRLNKDDGWTLLAFEITDWLLDQDIKEDA